MSDNPDQFDIWLGSEMTFATAIGQFAMRFAVLEFQINEAIRLLLKLGEEPGQVLTSAIQSFSLRLDILLALLDGLKTPPFAEEGLRKGVAEARRLNGVRNALLHDRWTGIIHDEDGTGFQKKRYVKEKRKRGAPFKLQDLRYSEKQVREYGSDCWKAARALNPFLNLLRAEIDAKQVMDQEV